MTTLRDDYTTALSKTINGSPAETAQKNNVRTELENALRSMANDCAEIANGDDATFLLSGFQIRSKPTPSGILPAPGKFDIKLGPFEGTLEIKFRSVKNAKAYELYYGKNDVSPDNWDLYKVTTAGKTILSDLGSNMLYSARVRAIGSKGLKGEWSEIVSRKTY